MSVTVETPMAVGNVRSGGTAPTPELVGKLRELVTQNSRRWKLLIVLEAIGLAISAPLAYLWLVFFIDNRVHLPLLGRVLASLGLLAGLTWAGGLLVRRWRNLHLTEDQVALAIERHTPGKVHNRLINAVQIARLAHGERAELSEAVIQENYERLQQVHLEQAAKVRPAVQRLLLAGGLIVFGLGFWLLSPDHFTNAAERIFLPLADIAPLYRTTLTVEPGDIEGSGDIVIRVQIQGERPNFLTIYKTVQGKRFAETVAVDADAGPVVHIFRDVTQSLDYSVRGNDFTSPVYRIEVPRKASFTKLRVTYEYPEYTGVPAKTVETTSGNLEALHGTRAKVHFLFDHPLSAAAIVLDRPASINAAGGSQPLQQLGPNEFAGDIVFQDLLGYHLEMGQAEQPKRRGPQYSVRILKDQEPKVELTGLERRADVEADALIPVQIIAGDDFGLQKVGLFFRRAVDGDVTRREDDGWQSIAIWPGEKKTSFKQAHELAIGALQVAEGEKIELAARAMDTDPNRAGLWITGMPHELIIEGDGVGLQLQYERILRGEAEFKAVIRSQQELLAKVVSWGLKLDGAGDLRWDDPKNIEALHSALKDLKKQQDELHKKASQLARGMTPQAGNLRIALGLLADAEMVRVLRILDSVPGREQPQAKRAALADARVTQERILRSLEEFDEQYQSFRSDWELSNMIPFTKLLADRQAKMRDQSRKHAAAGDKVQAFQMKSMARRQSKVLELCGLIQPAFAGLATRLADQESILAKAFQAGSATLAGDALLKPMRQAASAAEAGQWSQAVQEQTLAADALNALHTSLRKAQVEAAQKALAALREKAKSDLEAQKELEKLPPGTAEAMVKDYPENFKVEDLMRIREVVGAKKKPGNGTDEPDFKDALLRDVDRKQIELEKDSGVRQDPYILKLGTAAEGTSVLDLPKDKGKNKVQPFIQEKFDDLVGKLLDEADELHKNYQTINLSTNQNNNDGGDISKNGGSLNSTGAVAATGNKKPPTTDSGGVSRTGRQGARAHGMVADDEGVNRRGRDKALEGQEQVPDQKGTIKMKGSEDEQKDTSTGVGGKKVESDDTHFSLSDAGKWKDDMAKRMEKPQKKQYIVERQGDKMDPKVAAMLRDLTSKQEQVIERLKSIKKELKNLYLPTEHLDELAAALEANLEALKDRPEPELFRLQEQTLDRLRGTLRVFQGATAGFQPSLPRDRIIRGRVLDEPATQALPGYEEAVRQYYRKLAEQ